MKLSKVITALTAMLIAATVQATTLKLSADIDLLVLDGHKISGSLLKGADGLELERGEHQLLFRVERNLQGPGPVATAWHSTALIVTFTAQSQSVSIKLPLLATLREAKQFDKKPQFQLVDEQGNEIASKRDRLPGQAQGDLEQAMVLYNLDERIASVPRFAQPMRRSALGEAGPQDIALGQHPAERMLRLWYLQVDSATRQRLVMLLKALHTS